MIICLIEHLVNVFSSIKSRRYIRSDNTEVMRMRLMYQNWELALDDEILFALHADGFTLQDGTEVFSPMFCLDDGP